MRGLCRVPDAIRNVSKSPNSVRSLRIKHFNPFYCLGHFCGALNEEKRTPLAGCRLCPPGQTKGRPGHSIRGPDCCRRVPSKPKTFFNTGSSEEHGTDPAGMTRLPSPRKPTEGLLKIYLSINKALYGTFFLLHLNAMFTAPDG